MVMLQGVAETLKQGCNEVVVQKVTWGLKQRFFFFFFIELKISFSM